MRPRAILVWIPGRRVLHRDSCPYVARRRVVAYAPGRDIVAPSCAVWPHPKRDWTWRGLGRLCKRCKP